MPAAKKATRRRTRRAVKRRRSVTEREDAASDKLDEWLGKLDVALSKVKHYRKELKAARRARAREEAETELDLGAPGE